jgi:hypothetical protein
MLLAAILECVALVIAYRGTTGTCAGSVADSLSARVAVVRRGVREKRVI